MSQKAILMIGTDLNAFGGMTSVVSEYKRANLFLDSNIEYVATYQAPGLIRQLQVFFPAMAKLFLRCLSRRVSLMHVHSASRGSFWRKSVVCAVARVFKVPYILHLHSGEFSIFYESECGPIRRRWIRKTLREAACVLVLTEQWALTVARIEPSAVIEIMPNPVPVPLHLPDAATDPSVLFLGRLREKKGVYVLLNAIPGVLRQLPGTRFVLAGDGDIASVRARAEELGISHAVVTPGWLAGSAKDAAFESASVLALPSFFEGLPVCILEAMASGVPVVATNVGGIPDVVRNEETGLLVEAGDALALEQALLKLLLSGTRRDEIRLRAYEKAKDQFASDHVCTRLRGLYVRCMTEPPGFEAKRDANA